MMENIVLTKLKEFIKNKVELEKRLTNEFFLGQRDLVEKINFVRELITELIELVGSINEDEGTDTVACDVNGSIHIIGRVCLKATTPDNGVVFRINTEGGNHIDFLYYGENKNVIACGMKVSVLGSYGKNDTWTARTVEVVD